MKIPAEVIGFFERQNFVIVSSLDKDGSIHNACKEIVRIEQEGRIYLLDLYLQKTYRNLNADPRISVTAVDEHSFTGYSLRGRARIFAREEADPDIVREWERKMSARISQRLVSNVRGEKGRHGHPEAKLPQPRYIIMMEVREIIDLTPEHLKS